MTNQRGFLIIGMAAILIVGCSEEKKREAARLEAQLHGDSTVVESLGLGSVQDSVRRDTTGSGSEAVAAEPVTADTQPPAIDSHRVAISETSADQQADRESQPVQDTAVPDVNAIPEENGRAATTTSAPDLKSDVMPPSITDVYTIQVASSPSEAYSKGILDSFVARGYEAYLGTVTVGEKTYYRVRVGKYASRREANSVSSEINQKYGLQSWVDKVTR